ncbi:MAG: hypothetical protein ACXW2U_10890 [Telluria sp.]
MKSNDSINNQKTQPKSLRATLTNIDRNMDASGHGADHPWRIEIAGALAEPVAPVAVDAPIFSLPGENPYFHNASNATSELFKLVEGGVPRSAASADDRLRLMAVQSHAENEIQSIADGFSAIGSLVSLSGQVADDAGIPGITLIRLGILINQLADTLGKR